MSIDDDDILDGFLTIALLAYVQTAREQGGWPDSETTKKLAYGNYELHIKRLPSPSRSSRF